MNRLIEGDKYTNKFKMYRVINSQPRKHRQFIQKIKLVYKDQG